MPVDDDSLEPRAAPEAPARLLVAALAGLAFYLTIGIAAGTKRGSPDPLLGHTAAILTWGVSGLLLPRWTFTGTRWLAISVAVPWGLAATALYLLLTALFGPMPIAPLSAEAVIWELVLWLGLTLLSAPISVPLAVVSALVMRSCTPPRST